MFNILLNMSNTFFNRFKKKETQEVVVEDKNVVDNREFWISTLEKIALPVLDYLSSGSLKKNMPYESNSESGRKFTYLEAFARVFNGIAPWLELGGDNTSEGSIRQKYINFTLSAISNAVNPRNNDYIFLVEPKQSLVDVALFAQGLLRSKHQIWLNLPMDVQARIIRELKNTRMIAPYENHWLLYTSMIEAALLEFTGECDKERLTYGIYKFKDEFYVGDAIYSDGHDFNISYYNSLFIHPMLNDILVVMRKYGLQEGEFLDVQLKRTSRLAAQLERFIAPDGSYPLFGKSLAYRCGVFHALSQASLLKILPRNINQSQVRCGLTEVLKKQFEGEQNFTADGWLICGLNGSQLELCEENINTGSLYLCCAIFLPLGLKPDDIFWTGVDEDWSSLKAWNGGALRLDQPIS